jgi:pimeloyl-ACP methyl ester carboxylesterase
VFYREAGDPGSPALLLLHGFPTSSTQYHELIDLDHYGLYVFDFGAPIGFRLATRRPECVDALIVQNGNAYAAGIGPNLAPWRPTGRIARPPNRQRARSSNWTRRALSTPRALPIRGPSTLADVPDAELHLLDTGHFALATHAEAIADLIAAFYAKRRAADRTTAGASR